MKHGVFVAEVPLEAQGFIEYWWAGEKVHQEEFNRRSLDQMRAVAKDIDAIQMGMDLHEAIVEGEKLDKDVRLAELLVEADSHLSCIFHRFGNRLPENLVKDIGTTVDKIRKVTERRK